MRRNHFGHNTTQRYKHQKLTSSTSSNQLGYTSVKQTEFSAHSVSDLVEFHEVLLFFNVLKN
ncbi:MAG: hypothetical protein KKG64_05660 [Firmicutes bacterium]|nr:hypothetical protein [Bacillota bacterium]